jgi:hypothetical protein
VKVTIQYDTKTGLGTCVQGDQPCQIICVEQYAFPCESEPVPICEIGSPQPVTYIDNDQMNFTIKGWISLPPVVLKETAKHTPVLPEEDSWNNGWNWNWNDDGDLVKDHWTSY